MKQRYSYVSPAIRRIVTLAMQGEILSGSLENANIRSVGQQVDDYNYDFSNNNDGFNHQWQ
ncbi:MAG: hypothetical protein IKG86_06415 [Paludibacteraceae bacterium]|nr:hypothetical protein [Paludibacteraceae bacterium]